MAGGKFVVVTGCDSGFGRIVTGYLVKEGFHVLSGVFLEATIEELRKEIGSKCHPIRLDVSSGESVARFGEEVRRILEEEKGVLEGLVNNAGILTNPGPTEWAGIDTYERMINVNFLGTVRMCREFLPLIRESQGRIVNVASIAGRIGVPSQSAYCPSKYCVEAFSDILRRDMLQWGVTVHIIEPGVFNKTGLYGTFETGLDKLWGELPEHLKEDYGEDYYQFFRKMLTHSLVELGNTDSTLVPKAMVHALTSKQPKYRYRVGNDSKYLITFLSWLPEGWQDFLLTYVDPRLKAVTPTKAPKNGKQIATARYEPTKATYVIGLLVLFFLYRRFKN